MKTLTLIFGSLERESERQRQRERERERETKTVKREKIQLCSFEKTRFSSFPFFFWLSSCSSSSLANFLGFGLFF